MMRNKISKILMISGMLLIAVSLSLAIYNFMDERRAEVSINDILDNLTLLPSNNGSEYEAESDAHSAENDTFEVEIPDYILNPNMDMPIQSVDGNDYIGILQIPELDLELPVVSEWSYPSLKIAPCRYSGSAYLDNLVIVAHNYASHFGTIKKLQIGSSMYFTDADGNRFTYSVAEVEILEPTAIEEMTFSDWDLTLFTCTIGGQSRVTVRCERVD